MGRIYIKRGRNKEITVVAEKKIFEKPTREMLPPMPEKNARWNSITAMEKKLIRKQNKWAEAQTS